MGNEITREALAIMLYKYAQLKKIKTKKTAGASDGFADSDKISTYAKCDNDNEIVEIICRIEQNSVKMITGPFAECRKGLIILMFTLYLWKCYNFRCL